MKIKTLLLLLIFFHNNYILAQQDSVSLNKKQFFIATTSLITGVGLSYWYIQNSWWSEQQTSFHFDDGADLTYALNVDKAGHFMGGLQSADIFSSSMKWAGMSEKKALFYAAGFGSLSQFAIEMKDAYSPYWGFSKWDLATGILGSFWPVTQYYSDNFKVINFKFSYFKHSNIYWDLEAQRGKEVNSHAWMDDYPNQTYWLTFDINTVIKNDLWPDWLNIAVGFGLDDTQYINENNRKIGGNNEWYIALDYDFPKLVKKWNSPIAKKVKHWLNYFHFPAPTLIISPKIKFYPLFI